ncbi:2085_t:CDS:2 [Dentiscutata heterogama]|uniref:2085_t:CDS:1 n=1 Tax=Dentiscutata heterogama TaxID=1316150 RepID=A0ACA9L8Q3_9GLOM|nr:2085_t:CDS:2 [Dentiscutata heterogama]
MGCKISKNNQSNGVNSASDNLSKENTSKFVDGRKYQQADRLDLQHYIQKNIWQNNFFAPVGHLPEQEGTKVLDVGTGAGSWLFEMAADYPKAKFIGIDISLIDSFQTKPSNAEIIKGNVLERLPFDDNTYDYVFQRILYVGIPENKWPSVINELIRVLKPDGYLELLEPDFKPNNMGPATTKITDANNSFERGLDSNICYKLQNYLEENKQLYDVHCEIKKELDAENEEELRKLSSENFTTAVMTLKPKLASIMNGI